MDANSRRESIYDLLNRSEKPIKGIDMAEQFGVTRQVIVKDMAILKSKFDNIISTSEGYFILKPDNRIKKRIIVSHDENEILSELKTIIKYGAYIEDIIIEHPIYGEIRANLYLKSLNDLNKFMDGFEKSQAKPLSTLTEGMHMHTISVENTEDYELILKELEEKGFLIKED